MSIDPTDQQLVAHSLRCRAAEIRKDYADAVRFLNSFVSSWPPHIRDVFERASADVDAEVEDLYRIAGQLDQEPR